MGFVAFLAVLIQGVLIGAFCAYVAGQKNRSKASWFFLGFLFSLLALIALAAIPSLSNRGERNGTSVPQLEAGFSPSADTRKCPFCAEFVKSDAVICRFCQRDLPPDTSRATALAAAMSEHERESRNAA